MTARQFEKKVSSVLRKYEKYNVTDFREIVFFKAEFAVQMQFSQGVMLDV